MPYVVPDALTGLRVLCAVGLLIALIGENWTLALVLLLVGIISDAIDGEIIRRFKMPETGYGEVFDQAADALLWGFLFIGLFLSGQLPLIAFLVVIVAGAVFPLATSIPRESRWWFVRRHAHYIHPFSYAMTLGIGLVWLTWLAVWPAMANSLCLLYAGGAIMMIDVKRERIRQFLAGP